MLITIKSERFTLAFFYAIAFNFFAKPDFLLAAVFFLKTPLDTAQSIAEQVEENFAVAAALSPLSTKARNFLISVFTPDLIALFLAVFFSVTRTRFFADFILGIDKLL